MKREDIKCISPKGAKILRAILEPAKIKGHYKLDNTEGAFMPLSVEILVQGEKNNLGYFDISICHYGKLNGDLMCDPEMCFIWLKGSWYPYYFKNDYVGKEDQSLRFENFEITGIKRSIYKGHLEFAEIWLQNIKEQQEI